jgi:DNA-binding SARP family transcriptional activator
MNRARSVVNGSWQACHDTRLSAPGVDAFAAPYPGSDGITSLRMRLLGGFRVERTDAGQAVSDWPRRSAKTLVKLLAVQPGHALHREQVIDVLWPKVDAESALNSFGKALHVARHALEPRLPRRQDSAYLRLADGMLVLNTEHVLVDTDGFEQLAEDALRRREIAAYETALAAYGGELLPEDRYESWCSERRGALAELHIRLLLGLAEAFEYLCSYGEAADRLRDVLQQDPTREAVHRQLMLLYVRMGAPDQAVRQFHDCEAVLRQELDLVPQPETIALCDAVLANRLPPPRPRPDRTGGQADVRQLAPVHAVHGCPFVGRERVIRHMRGWITRRDEAQPGMIVVSGEAGVGKTRLLEEFAIQARAQGAVTLCGGRGAHADQFACGPFAVALEDYAANRAEAERAELARTYPALARFVPSLGAGIPPPAPAPDLRDYYLDLFPAIVQFLMDLARAKPVLLVLGDLHEADAVGLDLIRYLAHLAVGTPLLMVGALRDLDIEASAGLGQMIEAMTRERVWLRIDLQCLSRRATDQLVRAMLPGVYVSDDALAQIYAQSRGNPLFVRELAEGMRSRGDPDAADEGGQEPAPLAARLPTRRRILTGMRLALMDEPLRRVLGLAAAAGDAEISLSQLRAAAAALEPPVDVPVLFDALDRALRLHLLEERGEGYAFRHPVVRAALYDCLPRHRRDELCAALTAPGGSSARPADRLPRGFCLPGSCGLFQIPPAFPSICGDGWKSVGIHALPAGVSVFGAIADPARYRYGLRKPTCEPQHARAARPVRIARAADPAAYAGSALPCEISASLHAAPCSFPDSPAPMFSI